MLLDRTLQFFTEGYDFTQRLRARNADLDDVETRVPLRLMGGPAHVVRGRKGVELFYDTTRFKRSGSLPLPIEVSLFGVGAVHGLDGAKHDHRKALFVKLAYTPREVDRFVPFVEEEWQAALERVRARRSATAYDVAVEVYGTAIMRWAGIDDSDEALHRRAADLAQVVDGFGVIGLQHLRAWHNRAMCDLWASDLIREVRLGTRHPADGTALAEWAAYREGDGRQLDPRTAGVELQNVLRPTIAVARFAAFAVKALVEHPEWRERIHAEASARGQLSGGEIATAFAQEIRRFYPFVPILPAIATTTFDWEGVTIRKGERIFLDVYGTLRDEREFTDPDTFAPQRWLGVDGETVVAMVPQGGGPVRTGHRCPGERIALACLTSTVAALSDPSVTLSDRGLGYTNHRLPTKPESGGVFSVA